MKALTYLLVIILLAVAGWLIYSFYFTGDPVSVTRNFYEAWLVGEYGLKDGSYRKAEVLTEDFKSKIGEMIASGQKEGDDPILCASALPERFLVYEVGSNDKGVQVEVREDFSGVIKTVQVFLSKRDGKWKIDDISCGHLGELDGTEEKRLVSDYLKENISELSPKAAVLGGSFQIIDVIFGEGKTGVVEYEDGHIFLRAKFEYSLDQAKVVRIETFEILPEEEFAFSEIGNLVKDEGADGWLLVYEGPDQSSPRVILEFGADSRCQVIDGHIACDEWEIGDRVKIEGRRQGKKVIVNLAVEVEVQP